MIKTLLITLTVLQLASQLVYASTLPLRPFLGVAGSNSSTQVKGAFVDRVFTGGSGEALKLESGDLITIFNKSPIESFSHLIEKIRSIQVGAKIEVTIIRNDKSLQLSGKLKPRPQEKASQDSSFNIIYDSVKYQNNLLRSIIYRPKNASSKNKFPAVYFIQGYTCASIDNGLMPQSSDQQLLNFIADAGYVVYKIEKFGIGDSTGNTHCSEIDFSTELAGFNAGLDALKAYDFVDSDQVHLFGHSLGGVYAPFIAQHSPIKSLISYGSVVKSWHDYLLDIYSKQALIFGTSKQLAQTNAKTIEPLLKSWLKSDLTWQQITNLKENKTAIASNLIPINGEQVFHRHYSFFRDLNRYDVAKAWQTTNSHVLAIHGSLDIQAIDDSWATQMTTLPENKNIKTKKVVIKGAEHGFLKYDSMTQYLNARNDRSYNPSRSGKFYDHRISQTIIKWLDSLKTK